MVVKETGKHNPPGAPAASYLAGKGVIIPEPTQVVIGAEVPLDAISAGATLHPFCRISGEAMRIGAGAVIGLAGPATLENARVGEGCIIGELGPVTLKNVSCGPGTVLGCGVAEDAVFLGKESAENSFTTGYGFRVRKGSLYEEDASSAQHTDTKMTILLPWVTLGSNINWCDVLMAGGTGPGIGAMSEVGSGTIHFNFTPRGDKATASRFGNVVDGVFLDRPRLFLAGNGSMIGPLKADFGAITSAGGRFSGTLPGALNWNGSTPTANSGAFDLPYHLEIYGSVKRIYDSQLEYIGELAALDAWYAQVRALVAQGDAGRTALYAEGRRMVVLNIAERIVQLGRLAAAMDRSAALLQALAPKDARIAQQRALHDAWPRIESELQGFAAQADGMPAVLKQGLEDQGAKHGGIHTRIIPALPEGAVAAGREWLAGIRGRVANGGLLALVPAIASPR